MQVGIMIKEGVKWWNNGQVNKRSIECPGDSFVLGRIYYPRKPLTEETKEKIKKSNTGKVPWNKGKTEIYSKETLEKMRQAKENYTPWNVGLDMKQLGYVAWNNKVTGVGSTPLLAGGKRPLVGPTGFDFASVTKPG